MFKRTLLFGGIFSASLSMLTLSGCQKNPEFVNPVYACGCGALNWSGVEYPLLDANYILTDELEETSRRYYVTSDVKVEGENGAHSVNVIIEVNDVVESVFYVGDDDEDAILDVVIHEINENDPILPLRTYVPVDGVVQIVPAILGGTETASFNLIVRELYDGDLVGFEKSLTGNLSVQID
jgi:hypothetical protein